MEPKLASPINQEFFESIAKEIQGKFKRINHLTTAAPTAIGTYHENILRATISNFLSKRYSVKTGYMYYDQENVSNQIDIMIIDENKQYTYLFQEGDFAIVKPEAVICAIEVKTFLDSKEFCKAFHNIFEAKRIKSLHEMGGFGGRLTGLVFAYDGIEPTAQNLDKIFKSKELCESKKLRTDIDNPMLWPNLIQILEKKTSLYLDVRGELREDRKPYYYRIHQTSNTGKIDLEKALNDLPFQLSMLIRMIISSLEGQEEFDQRRIGGKLKSAQMTDQLTTLDHELYRPKEGLVIGNPDPNS